MTRQSDLPLLEPTTESYGSEETWPEPWCQLFLIQLEAGATITAAAQAAGIDKSRAYVLRRQNPRFTTAWDVALEQGKTVRSTPPGWIGPFLEAVKAGASTGVAARLAGVGASTVHQRSQRDQAFGDAWRVARLEAERNRHSDSESTSLRRKRLPLPPQASEQFWGHVDRSGGASACWTWQGRQEKGWGRFWYGGVYYQAHRASYELTYGAIPGGMGVLQECSNRLCVNPDHVILDRVEIHYREGESHPEAKLTDRQVAEIRQRYAGSDISARRLAEEYGVADTTILKLVHGDRRKNAGGPIGRRPSNKKSAGYWSLFGTLERELKAFISAHGTSGQMPSMPLLWRLGRGDLANAIRRHGGNTIVAQRLGLTASRQRGKAAIEQLPGKESPAAKRPNLPRQQEARPSAISATTQDDSARAGATPATTRPATPATTQDDSARAGATPATTRPATPPLPTRPAAAPARPAPAIQATPAAVSEPAPRPTPAQPVESAPSATDEPEQTGPQDQHLVCRTCGAIFLFTVAHQEQYKKNGWINLPDRCVDCEMRARMAPTRPQLRRGRR